MARQEIPADPLAPDSEPTDEQLANLMRLVGESVRARKAATEARFRETLIREIAEAKARLKARHA